MQLSKIPTMKKRDQFLKICKGNTDRKGKVNVYLKKAKMANFNPLKANILTSFMSNGQVRTAQ